MRKFIVKRTILYFETKGSTNTDTILSFTMLDSNKDAINITGYTFKLQVKKKSSDSTAVITANTSIINATGGEWQAVITKAMASSLDFKNEKYEYDIIYNDTSYDRPLLYGQVMQRTGISDI